MVCVEFQACEYGLIRITATLQGPVEECHWLVLDYLVWGEEAKSEEGMSTCPLFHLLHMCAGAFLLFSVMVLIS